MEEVEEIPTKAIKENIKLSVACSIQYFDLEGLIDGRSIKVLLSLIAPKKLVSFFLSFFLSSPL